jgi:hypothetical protein
MDENGDMRDDLHCNHDDELKAEIQKRFDNGDEMLITVLAAMGREQPIAIKNVAQK